MDSADHNEKSKLARPLMFLLCLLLAGMLLTAATAIGGLLPPIPKALAGPVLYQMVNATFIVALVFALLAFSLYYFLRVEPLAKAAAVLSFIAACVAPLTLTPVFAKQGRALSQDFQQNTAIRIADMGLFADQSEALSAVFGDAQILLRLGSWSESGPLYEGLANGDPQLALEKLRDVVRTKSASTHGPERLEAATASRHIAALIAPTDIMGAIDAYAAALKLDHNDTASLYWLGRSNIYVGRFDAAKDSFLKLSELGEDLSSSFISARANEGLARIAQIKGDYAEAERSFQLAQAVYANPVLNWECHPKCEMLDALMLAKLGETELLAKRPPEALGYYERSCKVRLRLLDQNNTIAARWASVSACNIGIGDSYRLQQRFDDAEPYYKKSLAMAKHALSLEPHSAAWLDSVALSYDRLGTVHGWRGQIAEARIYLLASYCIAHALHLRNPDNLRWQVNQAHELMRLSAVLMQQGHLEEALTLQKLAWSILDPLLSQVRLPGHESELLRNLTEIIPKASLAALPLVDIDEKETCKGLKELE